MNVKLVNISINVDLVEAMGDYGDYVFLEFECNCEPSHIFLNPEDTIAFRNWAVLNGIFNEDEHKECKRLSHDEFLEIETKVTNGDPLTNNESLKVLSALKSMTLDRNSLLRIGSKEKIHGYSEVKRPVQCLIDLDCDVKVDGSCKHNENRRVCWFWEGPEYWDL